MKGRIALVTGVGRREGIGFEVCKQLAARGVDIFFTYCFKYEDVTKSQQNSLDEVAFMSDALTKCGVRVAHAEVDLLDADCASKLLDAVRTQLGAPDILINNAALSEHLHYSTVTSKILDEHYAVNVRAPLMLALGLASGFTKEAGGRVINLTSGQSLGVMKDELPYTLTKAAGVMMVQQLYREFATKGITINAINPGPTDTGWITPELRTDFLKRFPMGRIGEAKDVANLITFLCSDEGAWITGQVINSEGGFARG